MDQRKDIIEKTLILLHAMEQFTWYNPWEEYYAKIISIMNELNDDEIVAKFVQITDMVNKTISQSVQDIKEMNRKYMNEQESLDKSQELENIATIINF